MKARLWLAGAVLAAALPARAQQVCTGGTAVQDACTKTVDLINFITPQLSTALAGGNATLGQGGTLAGWGHFAIDVRGTAVRGALPNLDNVGLNTSGAQASTFTAEEQFVPAVSANAAIGLWRGYSLGVSHIGGVDALVTATYLQDVEGGDVKLTLTGGNLKFGYGVRVGLLEESLLAPGVAVTYLKRDLPTMSIVGTVSSSGTGSGGSIELHSYSVKTTAWRVTASKNLLIFGFVAGYGQDKYESSGAVAVTVNAPGGAQEGDGSTKLSMTRTNMFGGLSVNLLLFKVVGEIGKVSGGSVPTPLNNFGASATESRTYYTLGVRIAI
ncbi:MAG TPA: hypothetical protein VJL28_10330 [Gemmatimonadaceae bacterium]|nr:hypothetical protein [Gemmatimonadaceae bacterium]